MSVEELTTRLNPAAALSGLPERTSRMTVFGRGLYSEMTATSNSFWRNCGGLGAKIAVLGRVCEIGTSSLATSSDEISSLLSCEESELRSNESREEERAGDFEEELAERGEGRG